MNERWPHTEEQRLRKNAIQRRYREKHYAKVRAMELRYKQSVRAHTLARGYAKKYYGSKKYKIAIRKRNANILAQQRNWRSKNRDRERVWIKRWQATPKGQKYLERHRFALPAEAPDGLLKVCQSLYQLRKELHEHH